MSEINDFSVPSKVERRIRKALKVANDRRRTNYERAAAYHVAERLAFKADIILL